MADINAGNIFYTVTIDRASLKRVEDEIVNLTQQLKRRGGDIGALSEEMTKFGARLDETVSSMKKMTEAASEAGVSAELMRDGAQTASGALDVYTQSAKEAKVSLERTAKANENAAVRIKRSQQATKQAAKASGDLAQRQANVSARLKEVVKNFKRTGQQAGVYVKKLTDLRAEQLLVLRALRKQRNETEKAGGDTTELTNRIASLEGQLAQTNSELSKHGTRLTKVGTAAERVKIGMAEMKAAATDLQTSFASGMGVDKAAREYANFMQRSRELERQLLKQREGLDKDSQAMTENTQRLAQLRAARQKAKDSAFQHGIALEQSGMEVLEVTQRADRLASELEQLQAKFESGEINASQFAEAFNRLQGEVSETADDLNKLSGAAGRTDAETKQLEGSTARLTRAERNASRQTRKLSARFEQMGRSQQLSYAASTLLNDQIFQMSPALGILTNSMIFTTDSFAAFARQAAPIVAIAGGLIGVFQGIVTSIKAGVGLESALEDVRKTTNLSSEGLEVLTQRFQTLSREIPVSVDEFLEMARVAGQLGITGVDNIERFATAVAKLGVATDVTGEQGAQALARFLQAVGTEAESMGAAAERVSNILNELENTTASTAAEILQMTSYTQGLSSAAGFTEDQILALNSALLSLGVKAEAGGSAVVRTLDGIQQAATEGGDTLARMAEVSGMTAERFSEVALASPVDAFMALAEGMNEAAENGENLSQLLSEMEVNEVRERRALLALAQGFDTLTAAMASAADQAILQNSIQSEVDIMAGKVESQVQLLKNQFAELAQDIGTALLPTVSRFLGVLNTVADSMATFISTITAASGALATFIAVANVKKIERLGVAISVLSRRNLRLLTRNFRTLTKNLKAANVQLVAMRKALRAADVQSFASAVRALATGALRVLRRSLRSTRAAMGLIGIAITAAATAFAFFQTRASRAEKELESIEERSDSLEASFAQSTSALDALAGAFNDLEEVSGMQGFLGVITDLAGKLDGEASVAFGNFYEEVLRGKIQQGELSEAIDLTREAFERLFALQLQEQRFDVTQQIENAREAQENIAEQLESFRGAGGAFGLGALEVGNFDDFADELRGLGIDLPEGSIGEQLRAFSELDREELDAALDTARDNQQLAYGAAGRIVNLYRGVKEIGPDLAKSYFEAERTLNTAQAQLDYIDAQEQELEARANALTEGGVSGGDPPTKEEVQESLFGNIINAFEAAQFDPRVNFDANAQTQFLYDQIISGIQSEISSGNISVEQGEAMAKELIGTLAKDLGVKLDDELDRIPDDVARIAGEKRRGDIGQAVADSVSQTLALEGLGEIGTVDAAQKIADSVSKAAQTMLSEGLISAEEYDQTVMQLIETLAGSNETVSDFAKSLVGGTEVPTAELAAARMEYEEAVAAARVSFESGFISEEEFLTQQRGALRTQIETVRGLDADASELVARYNQLGETINNVREGDALAEFFSNINNEIESALSEAEAAANLGVGEELSDVESRLIILDEATSGIISGVKAGQISPDEANGLLRKILQPFEDDFPGILEESQQELQQILDDELAGLDINQTLDDAISQALTLEEVGVVNIRDTAKNIADSVTQAARTMLFQGLISSEEYEQTIIELIGNIEGADEELLKLVERRAGVAEISVPEVTVEEPGGSGRTQQQIDDLKELSDAREQYEEAVAQANAEFEAGFITEQELLTRIQRALGVQIETIIAVDGNVSDLVQQYKELGGAIDEFSTQDKLAAALEELERVRKENAEQVGILKTEEEALNDEIKVQNAVIEANIAKHGRQSEEVKQAIADRKELRLALRKLAEEEERAAEAAEKRQAAMDAEGERQSKAFMGRAFREATKDAETYEEAVSGLFDYFKTVTPELLEMAEEAFPEDFAATEGLAAALKELERVRKENADLVGITKTEEEALTDEIVAQNAVLEASIAKHGKESEEVKRLIALIDELELSLRRVNEEKDARDELNDAIKNKNEVEKKNAQQVGILITEEEALNNKIKAQERFIAALIDVYGRQSVVVKNAKAELEGLQGALDGFSPPSNQEFEEVTKSAYTYNEALEDLKDKYGEELPDGAAEFLDTFPDVSRAVAQAVTVFSHLGDTLSGFAESINSEVNPGLAGFIGTLGNLASAVSGNTTQIFNMFKKVKEGGRGSAEGIGFFADMLGNALPEQTSKANKALDTFATTAGTLIGSFFGPGGAKIGAQIGGAISNIVGDISNGAKQIKQKIDEIKESSEFLSRSLIESFAESSSEVKSRGGLLGALGFTKKVVDEEELQELVSIAEGFAGSIADAIRAGIDSKLAGNQDWKEDLEGTLKEGIRDALINSLIQAAVVAAEIEPFLEEVTRLIQEGSTEAAADYVEANYEDVVQEAIESSERVMAALPDSFFDEGPNFTEAGKFLGDSFGEALRESVKEQMGKLDEDIHNTAMDISNSVANSVANALMTGIKSYMMGDKDWEQALNDSITQSLIDAIVESFVNAAIVEGLMADFLSDFSTSVAKASEIEDEDERNSAYKEIFNNAGNDLNQIMKDANVIVKGFGEMAREAFGDQIAGMEGAGDFESAGTQISEITGPTRDLLVDLLTPLSIIPTWTGLIQDIRNDVRSIARGRNILPSLPPREVQPIQMTQATTVSGGSVYNVNIGTIKTDSDNVRDLVSDISKFTYKERRGGKK